MAKSPSGTFKIAHHYTALQSAKQSAGASSAIGARGADLDASDDALNAASAGSAAKELVDEADLGHLCRRFKPCRCPGFQIRDMLAQDRGGHHAKDEVDVFVRYQSMTWGLQRWLSARISIRVFGKLLRIARARQRGGGQLPLNRLAGRSSRRLADAAGTSSRNGNDIQFLIGLLWIRGTVAFRGPGNGAVPPGRRL
ncbi:hypothetical protein [Mesorhizobium sp.]|uniref:hypothetical protein n=1 Tax=Mesorhizobium sp. TaxID=1871066 RepID=UPI00257CF8B9|nr:hypothetical protein [Mesorhizobium sp.]